MREFDEVDPQFVKDDPRLVSSSDDPDSGHYRYYLLIDDDYAILAHTGFHPYAKKWLGDQLEFPKEGLPWFVDTIEQKFFRREDEGGLPGGTFHLTESIRGERLKVQRCFGLGDIDQRETGYEFITVDRRQRTGISRSRSCTDRVLFEEGLFDWFKEQADRIRRGEI